MIDAKALVFLGDSVTTDHISPAGAISEAYPAGRYLKEKAVIPAEFNSYGSRRGNHEVMIRGTFGNIRVKNRLVAPKEGSYTIKFPEGGEMFIYDAAAAYRKEGIPLVILGGKEYGSGSSRDWAAKGTRLLGVKAVITESFERIHRSNLVGMGILPLVFEPGTTRHTLKLDGLETFSITGLSAGLKPKMTVQCTITRTDGSSESIPLLVRLDTGNEVEYFRNGGILHYVLRNMMKAG